MTNYEQAVTLATQLIEESQGYSRRPTKACSRRLRAILNDLKKVATDAKRDLIEADKG